jgi:Zn-finger nucleic acid-binding protein
MICPNCQTELKPIDLKGIVIHECPECKGKWLKRDQLRLAKDRQDEHLRWLDFDPFGKDADTLSVASEGKVCPECARMMSSLKYRQSEIIIDKCPKCEGIWLDHGELGKIIRYLERLLSSETAKEYVKDSFGQFIEIFKGREGFISEVKDFLAVFYLLRLRIAVDHPKLSKASEYIYKYTPFK